MVGCQGSQGCAAAPLWLPDSVKEASVEETTCNSCNLRPRKVGLVLSRGALAPHYPDRFSACLGGCDVFLLQALGVSRLNSGALVRPRQEDRGRGARGGVHRGGGPRGGGDGRGERRSSRGWRIQAKGKGGERIIQGGRRYHESANHVLRTTGLMNRCRRSRATFAHGDAETRALGRHPRNTWPWSQPGSLRPLARVGRTMME